MEKESLVRKILEHEATKIVSIVVIIWSIFSKVILPIQQINSSLVIIASDIKDIKKFKDKSQEQLTNQDKELALIKQFLGIQ